MNVKEHFFCSVYKNDNWLHKDVSYHFFIQISLTSPVKHSTILVRLYKNNVRNYKKEMGKEHEDFN